MKKIENPIAFMISVILIVSLLYSIPSIKAENIDGYGLSNPRIKDAIPTISHKMATWDCIYFGNYWQNDTNGDGVADQNDDKEPIKWRVLEVNGDDAFLLADQNLDAQPYNQEREVVTWETCTLRSWLNDDFYNTAFNDTEQNAIKTTDIEGDTIYLLSYDDTYNIQYGFTEHSYYYPETRNSINTPYAKACGALTKDGNIGNWWTYSQYRDNTDVANWANNGTSQPVDDPTGAVRPCLHIDLSSSVWTKAGTVCSNGEVTDKSIAELTTATAVTTTEEPRVKQSYPTTTPTQTYIAPKVTAATTTQAPKDKTKPTVKGVKKNKIYKKAVIIKFSDKQSGIKKATLNGKKIKNGKKVKKNGKYTLKVYDKAGNCTTVKFLVKIRKKK